MRRTFLLHHRMPTLYLFLIVQTLGTLVLWFSCLQFVGQAHAEAPITPSGLNTEVSQPATLPSGQTQYDITGGTRPGGVTGTNLFHSFGDFNVPTNNIANFLNAGSVDLAGNPLAAGLPTSNILGSVTGANPSTIFGMIQTNGTGGFGNANLFLMNPHGFLFGPNATVNVGGMVAFTTADYLRLANGVLFNATRNAAADALLSAAPVAAFGFLGSNPTAIAVQGSKLAVHPGQSISLVGGNQGFTYTNPDTGSTASVPDGLTVAGGHLLAPGGQVNIASVASPGEILVGTLAQAPNINGQSFGALGTIQISQQSVIDVSGDGGGTVLIRGGRFVIDDSTISANAEGPGPITNGTESIGGGIDIQVSQDAVIQNLAVLETNVVGNATPDVQYGSVHVEAEHIEIAGVLDFELFPFTGIRSDVHTGSTGGQSGNIELEANSILGKDLGQIETLTEGAGDAGNIRLTATRDIDLNTVLIQSSSVDAAGNAGDIDLISTSGNISMTTFTLVTSQASFSNGQAGTLTLSAPSGNILLADQALVFNQSSNAGPIGGIEITAKSLELHGGSFISGDNLTTLIPGNISITLSDNLSLDGGSGIATVSRGQAASADLTIRAHDVSIADNSFLTTEAFLSGPGGRLNIATENLQLTSGGQLRSGSVIGMDEFGPTIPSGAGGTITIHGLTGQAESIVFDGPVSGLFTDTQGTGAGGNIFVNADSVTLQNGGRLSAATSGTEVTATGGNITVHADQIALQSGAVITSSTSGTGDGGTVSLYANESISLVNSSIASNSETPPGTPIVGNGGQLNLSAPSITLEQGSALLALTTGSGRAGAIELNHNNLSLADRSVVQTSTFGPGPAGSITVQGLGGSGTKAHTVLLAGGSSLSSSSLGNDEGEGGAAGNILVETQTLSLSGGSQITTSSIFSPGNAGTITINAGEEVQLSQGILTSRSESNIPDEFVKDYVIGNAGSIIVSAPSVTLKNHSLIASTTDSRYTGDPSKGNAGSVTVNATNLSLTEGSQLTSSSIIGESGQSPVGNAGSVTAQVLASPASSVLISGPGSGLFTETQGTGAGGNIFVDANSVTLTNGATVSASSTGQIENPGAAGSIDITATNGFTMQNSAITTQAGQGASGGDIKLTTAPSATVLLENSRISASVADGPGGGGNISIDPQYVILQNSQILAQAAQGQGGAITITANLFLPDATSIVNADSGSGVNGTVTIQSPNAPASGKIQPLGKTPLLATSLLNQPCAALAGGEFSSFTVAGRDSLPTEPGSWLASPLATLSAGMGLGVKAEGVRPVVQGEGQEGKTELLSLRQIAPAGFLTQAFALDWSAGCGS